MFLYQWQFVRNIVIDEDYIVFMEGCHGDDGQWLYRWRSTSPNGCTDYGAGYPTPYDHDAYRGGIEESDRLDDLFEENQDGDIEDDV